MIFATALLSSRTRIPHIIVLVIFGIGLSFLSFVGLDFVNVSGFRIDPRLIINFVIPPLIFEAMMKVNYKQFKTVRISALLLATAGVVVSTFVAGFLLMYVAGLRLRRLVSFCCANLPDGSSYSDRDIQEVKSP